MKFTNKTYWEKKIPTWSSLNKYGKSKILSTSYYWLIGVPLLAKVLSKLEDTFSVTLFGKEYQLVLGLPFSWKYFFFSSLAFSVAKIFYSLSCPEFIRDYDTYNKFKETGKGSRQIVEAFEKYNGAETSTKFAIKFIREFAEPVITKTEGMDIIVIKDLDIIIPKSFDFVKIRTGLLGAAFSFVYGYLDTHSPRLRTLCGSFYLVGFLLLAPVVIQNIWFVIQYS